jgi:hypothetical protein
VLLKGLKTFLVFAQLCKHFGKLSAKFEKEEIFTFTIGFTRKGKISHENVRFQVFFARIFRTNISENVGFSGEEKR